MRTILIINDDSPAAAHAAQFVFKLAQQQNANIIIANTRVNKPKPAKDLSLSYTGDDLEEEEEVSVTGVNLLGVNGYEPNFLSKIKEIDISNTNECALAEFIKHNDVWMIVKGTSTTGADAQTGGQPKVHIVLNEITCPLLLIPEHWPLKMIERIMYVSDLRYCRMKIMHYLARFAKLSGADLSFAHLTAKGLPDICDEYALDLFTNEICGNVKYDKLFFNKVKEKDITAAIDVMVNGMKSDMLAFVNHHFHIEEILGDYETKLGSAQISVPVLIFPY
jgi:hypothetical protein